MPLAQPEHISHSSRDTLLRCAKSYFLSKIAGAPRWPALWLAGGSAVHEVTEAYDQWSLPPDTGQPFPLLDYWERVFEAQLDHLRARMDNEQAWRQSPSEPVRVWRQMGLQLVQAYIDWRERSGWEIWITPDGQPAIELDVSGYLPGCPVEIKAYIDRVMYDPMFDKYWVLDLKTGKRRPASADQFGTYAALLKVKYGIDVQHAVAFMNRRGTISDPYDLTEYTPTFVGEMYAVAWEQIQDYMQAGFPADGFDKECFLCDVQSACFVKNGPLAARYDPDHPDYPPL